MATTTLGIAHFNDVYQVSEQKIYVDGKPENIDVSKFASSLVEVTSKWETRPDGSKDGLIIFSGDLFSPSIETSVTRGRHMPPIINGLKVDVACPGNHEFDMGVPRLEELISDTKFPWLLSNIIDTSTGTVPRTTKELHVIEKRGIRIGVVGLVEKDWIATITGWPDTFEWQDDAEVGQRLSARLRDPNGEYKCDLVIAVTHSRFAHDIKLARDLNALSPAAQASRDIASLPGVDLILGGHDHVYWISKGVTEWEGYDLNTPQPEAADDNGDILIVKSGTDFQDLSEVMLTLRDAPPGSLRKKIIQEIRGRRIVTRGDNPVNTEIKELMDKELSTINESLKEVVCRTEVWIDSRSELIRHHESPVADWITDALRHSYDEALVKLGYTGVDGCLINCGSIRGDRIYEPGPITLGDLMTMMPYAQPMVVVEISATDFYCAIENGFSHWPQQEGRFPAVSGFRVSWDSTKPAGQRVNGIWLLENSKKVGPDNKPILVDKEEVLRTSTRKYLLMIGEYMSQGGDGYTDLANKKFIITSEGGQPNNALVRKFLLGLQSLNQQLRKKPEDRKCLDPKSADAIDAAENYLKDLHTQYHESTSSLRSIPILGSALSLLQGIVHRGAPSEGSLPLYKLLDSTPLTTAAHRLGNHEDMGLLDCYERRRRQVLGKDEVKVDAVDEEVKKTLPVIHPAIDGRLKDISGQAA